MEEQAPGQPQPPPPTPARAPWGTWLKALAGFVAPTTLLTALLLYFGYAFTDAQYEYFGIDPATLGFSTQDFLLRSAAALWMPVGVTLFVGLVAALGYFWAAAVAGSRPHLLRRVTRAGVCLLMCGVGLFALGVLGGFQVWPAAQLTTPLLLLCGLLLVVYGRLMHLKATGRPFVGEVTAFCIAAALITLCSFWAVQAYAQGHGEHEARYLARHLRLRPEVVVDTTERLYFTAPGVRETSLPEGGSGQHFKYRYRGLRLLAQSGDRMFIVPKSWTRQRGAVLVLPVGAGVRVAFRPG
ncbi:hypothetical protein AB0M57_32345 [Streptomyces sp. NPDC051597]|uniref:hypothetical protein n=1 Tax=Streptomyces sp. NPDC051597 TaxID=3155049 RepID=UPI00342D8BFB